MIPVVFDTNVVVSALLFSSGVAGELRSAWRSSDFEALVSEPTVDELIRVLAYPKFALAAAEIELLLADYLPHARRIRPPKRRPRALPRCRDREDEKFLELASAGGARYLVTGDRDLLALAARVPFEIVSVAAFLGAQRS